jgi:hypothetical protein
MQSLRSGFRLSGSARTRECAPASTPGARNASSNARGSGVPRTASPSAPINEKRRAEYPATRRNKYPATRRSASNHRSAA